MVKTYGMYAFNFSWSLIIQIFSINLFEKIIMNLNNANSEELYVANVHSYEVRKFMENIPNATKFYCWKDKYPLIVHVS